MEDLSIDLSSDDLFEIVSCIDEVKADYFKIGVALRLKHSIVDGIKKEKLDHAESLMKVINEWLLKNYDWKKHGKPTWKALVEAVQNPAGGNNTELAIKIATDHPAGNFRNAVNVFPSGHALTSQRSGSASSGASVFSPASPGWSLPVSLPSVNASSSSSSSSLDSDEEDLEQQLDQDSRMIQTQYAKYVYCIREIVESKGVSPGQLSSFLVNLPASNSDRRRKSSLLSYAKDELQKAAEISEIFVLLSRKCASFLDFDIFKTILQQYGSAEKRKELEYPSRLKDYLEKQKIEEFVRHHPELLNFKLKKLCNGLTKIYVKLNIKRTQNLNTIKEVTRAVANILGIKSSALQLCRVRKGCVLVTLLISNVIAENIFTSDVIFASHEIRQFQEAKVMWLKCNGYKFDFRDEDSYTRSIEEDQHFFEIIAKNVPISSLRYFGIMIKIAPEKLKQLHLQDRDSAINLIVKEWFKIPMRLTKRWEQLNKALWDLQDQERTLSEDLKPCTMHGSSDSDSAFNESYTTLSSSILSFGDLVLEEASAQHHTEDENAPVKIAEKTSNKDLVVKLIPENEGKKKEIVQEGVSKVQVTSDLAQAPDGEGNYSVKEKFSESCKIGHFEDVKRCLTEENVDPNIIYEESRGWNSVMCAAFYGQLSVVNLLIDYGAEVNKQDYTGCTALILASNERHLDVVELLLEKGADPNIVENHGLCPLLIGAKWNFVNLVKLVCVKSPLTKMDIVDINSKTALILAAEEGNVDVVRFLLREEFLERINAEHQDENGRAAIHVVAESGNLEIADLLLNAFPETRDLQDKDGNTPLSIAKRTSNGDLVALLSSELDEEEKQKVVKGEVSKEKEEGEQVEGAGEGTIEETHTTKRLGSTIIRLFRSAKLKNLNLLRAAKAGNARKVEKLLKSGAEPNTIEIDTLQWTPLMWASQKNHVETVKVLLKYKADPNCQARNGFTALILASRLGNHEVVKVLLNPTNLIKTDVQIKNKTRGWSALMWACRSRGKQSDNEEARANRRIVAKYLLDKGADINSIADNGWTPIMQASQDGDVKMVKILTSHESSQNSLEIDHESDSTWTALTTACRKKHLDIIKVLVDAGADVNKKKKGGVAPLHITAIKQMVEASDYLIKHGADVNIQDDWGITPLILAVKENDREKQDYQNLIHYHICVAKANVNLQAEKFAKWTALFFSIKNKDQKTSKFLVKNKAQLDIEDEYGHTPFSISKGLILDEKNQMYKFLVNLVFPPKKESQEESTPKVTHPKRRESFAEEKSFSVADGAVYAAMDLRFRMTQLPNYLVNFNLHLPAF